MSAPNKFESQEDQVNLLSSYKNIFKVVRTVNPLIQDYNVSELLKVAMQGLKSDLNGFAGTSDFPIDEFLRTNQALLKAIECHPEHMQQYLEEMPFD